MEIFGKKSRPAFLGYTEDKVLQENAVEMECNAAETLLLLFFFSGGWVGVRNVQQKIVQKSTVGIVVFKSVKNWMWR